MVQLIKSVGVLPNSVIKGIQLRRTKATYTVVHGIGYHEAIKTVSILKNQKFSILLDKSTGVSTTQTLARVVRFLDIIRKQTADRLFDVIEVTDGTSLGLFQSVSKILFEEYGLQPAHLIGLGAWAPAGGALAPPWISSGKCATAQ